MPIHRMRPAVERLRDELDTAYPLASSRVWLDVSGQELVRRIQDEVHLARPLSLVVVRSGQGVLDWSHGAQDFKLSSHWEQAGKGTEIGSLLAEASNSEVVLNPRVNFGDPTVAGRAVRTEVLGELFRAGEDVDAIARMYELERPQVDAALRYEMRRSRAS